MKLCVLGSGSKGNCIYVENEGTALLVDAGLSARETLRRMEQAGLDPSLLRAICISHEHSDHTGGALRLHRKLDLPLYANSATANAIRDTKDIPWNLFHNGSPFSIGALSILPFSLPHDAYDPVGFVLSGGGHRIGIATDLGMPTTLARETLRGCQILVLEANHDEDMLRTSPRPWSLKQRILGRQGHLSNRTAAAMLAEIATPDLQDVFLAHLSADCNTPEQALTTVGAMLAEADLSRIHLHLTHPDRPTECCCCLCPPS